MDNIEAVSIISPGNHCYTDCIVILAVVDFCVEDQESNGSNVTYIAS